MITQRSYSAEQIAHALDKPRRTGTNTWRAICPVCGGRSSALSITQTADKVLLYCFKGCPQEALIDTLQSRGLWHQSNTARPISARPISPPPVQPNYADTEARAQRAVSLATPAPCNHPYLIRKGVKAHGIGVLGELYRASPAMVRNKGNVLVIPMQNVHGKVLSCQFVSEDGSKCYLAGPKRPGGFFLISGGPRLWICEGYATGASLHEDTGDTVAIAFDAGGLMPVTGALTALYPKRQIIVMADDDWRTDNNPGIAKALAAASAHGVKAAHPDFSGFNRGPKDTDFNDLVRLRNE